MCAQLLDVSIDVNLFTDHTGGYHGTGVSFVDFNSDGFDDLTFGHHEGLIKFYEGNGSSFSEVDLGINTEGFEAKGICWIDFDNDDDLDLFVANRLAPNKIWRNDCSEFTDISATCGISQTLSKSYGMSFGDFDNDGYLDFYICNYQLWFDTGFENELYHNNGDGTFENVTAQAGVGNGLKQSFQSSWIDINNDGYLDIHIANDRHEFLNAFYLNQGDGTFIDEAESLNANVSALAMSSSFADFDRDGDQDIFISNGIDGNIFLENRINEIGQFIDIAPSYGSEINNYCWGAEWIDFNNDTWPDLHVSLGITVYTDYPEILDVIPPLNDVLYLNNGFPPFENGSLEINDSPQHSFAVAQGDFNNDGVPDMVSHKIGELASLYKGVPSTNNWVKVKLNGTASNTMGIGCSIEVNRILFNGQTQGLQKIVFAGDNYLGQDSYWQHFGLGASTEIEKITVTWTSGIQEVYGPFETNQHIVLTETSDIQTVTSWGCTYPIACNYDPTVFNDDGSCDFSCICGENSVWDDELEKCIQNISCPTDVNSNGHTEVGDLLLVLAEYSAGC